MFNNVVKLFLSLIFLTSCATSQKSKITETILTGAALGALYGLSRPEMKSANAMMFGSQGAAAGAIIGLYYHDPDKEISDLNSKIKQMTKFQEAMEKNITNVSTVTGAGENGSQSLVESQDIKNLKTSGWQEYKTDGYFRVAPNLIYHHTGLLTPDPKKLSDEE